MKNSLIFILLIFCKSFIFGQDKKPSYLEFGLGRSIHGTGDTPGYHYGFSFGQAFSKKMYWQIGFEGTLNDTPDFLLTYVDDLGNVYDASLHTVTAGFQLISGIRYNFIQSSNHQFGVSLLPVFRYQATSLSDFYATLYPTLTGLPIPVRDITRIEPGRTFALGVTLRLQYNYLFDNNFYLGINGAFQTDTNGDTIPSYFLTIGKKFN